MSARAALLEELADLLRDQSLSDREFESRKGALMQRLNASAPEFVMAAPGPREVMERTLNQYGDDDQVGPAYPVPYTIEVERGRDGLVTRYFLTPVIGKVRR
jgi:hypothetical protein